MVVVARRGAWTSAVSYAPPCKAAELLQILLVSSEESEFAGKPLQ